MKGETKIMQRSELAKALDNLTHEEKGEVLAILVENNEDIDYVSTTRYITGVYYLTICYNKEPSSVFKRNKQVKSDLLDIIV